MKKVLSFVREHHMIEKGDHVLAAVSGGADSVCLLLMLQRLREAIPMRISVIHVEHGIRGEASKKDAAFVRSLCESCGIPCFVYECDAAAYARDRGVGLEEGARALRYELFEACCREQKADKIAVAHNQNDCAETVLFHMARGTGPKGLRGIVPVRGKVIRPLLCMERGEIEAFLREQKQSYCTDATNQELLYSRNKLRHQVLPVLSEINAKATGHIYQLAQSMTEVWELVEQQTAQARQRLVERRVPEPEKIFFLREEIAGEAPLIQSTLVMEALSRCAGSQKDLTRAHVDQVLELLNHQVGHRVSLPYGMQASRTYGGVELEQRASVERRNETEPPREQTENGKSYCQTLDLGKEQELLEYGITISGKILEKKADFQEIPKKKYTKWFDYDKIKNRLLLRNPQSEDYLVIDSQGRTQSLKKYFVNEKLPARQRREQLVLADGAHILWVIGYRISEACKVTDHTTRILEVQVRRADGTEQSMDSGTEQIDTEPENTDKRRDIHE